jgi:hypothetical protein
MLVILLENQVLASGQVCQSCLLANASGEPRLREGKLGCGRVISQLNDQQPEQYQCIMGFRIVKIE